MRAREIAYVATCIVASSIAMACGGKPDPKTPADEHEPAAPSDGEKLEPPAPHEGDVGDPKPPKDDDDPPKPPGESPSHR